MSLLRFRGCIWVLSWGYAMQSIVLHSWCVWRPCVIKSPKWLLNCCCAILKMMYVYPAFVLIKYTVQDFAAALPTLCTHTQLWSQQPTPWVPFLCSSSTLFRCPWFKYPSPPPLPHPLPTNIAGVQHALVHHVPSALPCVCVYACWSEVMLTTEWVRILCT